MFKTVNSPATSLDFFRFLLFYFLKIYCMIEISKESGDLNFMKKDIVFYFSLLLLSIFLSYKTQSDYATGIVYVLLFCAAHFISQYKDCKLSVKIIIAFLLLLIGSFLIFMGTGLSQKLYSFWLLWIIFLIKTIIQDFYLNPTKRRKNHSSL